MERSALASTSSAFVTWEEVFVSGDKGRKEVHFLLVRRDGTSDLAVVGRESSSRHMSYRYAIRDRSLLPASPSSSLLKLKSRREVIDLLNSIVSDSQLDQPSQQVGSSLDGKCARELDVKILKDVQLSQLGQDSAKFSWLGSSWTCRKRRRHYQAFLRNGVKISVHGFVYVLAEEDKRLVAYLDDIYEDSRGNKMAVVRWFHKIDEVGIILPQNYNDREIFFSLCLQDLSIECVDGLATVLSPQHYEKFVDEAAHTQFEPFVCHRQFDNDDVKPFDVTQVKGYWKQELVRYLFTSSLPKIPARSHSPCDSLKVESNLSDAFSTRPRKRLCRWKDHDQKLHSTSKLESADSCLDKESVGDRSGVKSETPMCNAKDVVFASMPGKEATLEKPSEHLCLGSQVEVLSQDSGIRGCWFRALVIKKHKNKVKLQYQDIKDAADEAKNLEEWVLASKVAIDDDQWGIRIRGRPIIRPTALPNKGKVSWVVSVGTAVDVWWHDGWWEGIVVRKEADDKFHVYFPGEKRESVFGRSDLRHSQEWLGNGWKHIKERPDIVAKYGLHMKQNMVKLPDINKIQIVTCDKKPVGGNVCKDRLSVMDEVRCSRLEDPVDYKVRKIVRDLTKDELFAQLKWKSSRKRRHFANSAQKLHYSGNKNSSSLPLRKKNSASLEALGLGSCDIFLFPTSLKADNDNCKYTPESLFSSSAVPPLTSLVMSR